MKKSKQLVVTFCPKVDESLRGYLLRLAENNCYHSILPMLKVIGLNDFTFITSTNKHIFESIATLTGVSIDQLMSRAYPSVSSKLTFFLGHPLHRKFILLNNVRICPVCLKESPYCRIIWELSPVTTCPKHNCLLIESCPVCGTKISWRRSHVAICKCEYDFRSIKPPKLQNHELKLSRHIHAVVNYKVYNNCDHPLDKLTLNNFLLILFFIASQVLTTNYAQHGRYLLPYVQNTLLHEILTQSYAVFDDWPFKYYQLLDTLRKRHGDIELKKSPKKTLFMYRKRISREFSDNELHFFREAFDSYYLGEHIGSGSKASINRHAKT